MKQMIVNLLFGKNTKLSGLIAFSIVAVIALGCSCAKELGNLSEKDDSTTASNTTTGTNTSTKTVSQPDASTGQVPNDEQLQDLAKTTVLAFNDAIQSEDFTDFHRDIAKPFQKEASPERFKQVFKSFIDGNINLSEVRSLPAYMQPAIIDKSRGANTLKLKGSYTTTPRRTNFDLQYVPEGDDWKLIYIEINTKD